MSDDIVTRLREAGECPTPLRAYLARAVVLRAAEEIECLRADVMCLKYQNAEFVRNLTMAQDERNAAVAERDEARRDACVYEARYHEERAYPLDIPREEWIQRDAKRIAAERGWDCFKEDDK